MNQSKIPGSESNIAQSNNWLRAFRDFRITLTFLTMVGIGLGFLLLQKVADPYVAFITALSCLAAGGIIGFIFGIPRVLQKGRDPAQFSK